MSLLKTLPLTLALCSFVASVHAADRSPLNSTLYYDIGGGEVINFPMSRKNPTHIGVEASFKLPTLCEIWDRKIDNPDDVTAYVEMVADYATGELDRLGEQVVEFLVTAPATIAVASLQRALPGMYDYSQNLKAQMDVSIDYAKQSCAAVVETMDNNASPWSGWLTASTSTHWRTMLDEDEVPNILEAEKKINELHGETSVQWFGDKRGADDEKPIKLVKDVVSAGFAATIKEPYVGENVSAAGSESNYQMLTEGEPSTQPRPDPIIATFGDSDTAAEFAVGVLGEQTIIYCAECGQGGFTPGTGLKPRYAKERDDLIDEWTGLFKDFNGESNPPTRTRLQKVSSNKVAITKDVWVALERMAKQDRDLLVYRLISDVSVERTVNKAVAIRQFIKSGISTPDVQSYAHAKEEADRLADQMKDEINDFLWEIETMENLASSTALSILQADTIDGLNNLQAIRNYTDSSNSNFNTSQGPLK